MSNYARPEFKFDKPRAQVGNSLFLNILGSRLCPKNGQLIVRTVELSVEAIGLVAG